MAKMDMLMAKRWKGRCCVLSCVHGFSEVVILPRDRRCCCDDKVSKSAFDSPHTPCYSLTSCPCQSKDYTFAMDAEHFTSPVPDFPKKRCG